MRRLAPLLLLTLVGCLSQSSLDGLALAPDRMGGGATFFVRKHAKDTRSFDELIARVLSGHGVAATAQEPERYDYLVTYEDRWQWDMRMYLADLRIDVREAESDLLVATARSYQTSLAAMGETHESIVEGAVRVLLEGPKRVRSMGVERQAGRC